MHTYRPVGFETHTQAHISGYSLTPACSLSTLITLRQLLEHNLKLVKRDLTVAIDIDLLDDRLPDLLRLCTIVAINARNLARINRATIVLVEQIEGGPHVWLREQLLLVDRGCGPLAEIYRAVPIDVSVSKHCEGALIDRTRILVWVKRAVRM